MIFDQREYDIRFEWGLRGAEDALFDFVRACSSGKELAASNHEADIGLACQIDADAVAPCLVDEAYRAVE